MMPTEEWLEKIRSRLTLPFHLSKFYREDVPRLLQELDMRQLAIDEILEIQAELKERVRTLEEERDNLRLDLNIR